jgi:hypothetical protein
MVNKPWLITFAVVIVSLLVMLSLILATVTIFPNVDASEPAAVQGYVLSKISHE